MTADWFWEFVEKTRFKLAYSLQFSIVYQFALYFHME